MNNLIFTNPNSSSFKVIQYEDQDRSVIVQNSFIGILDQNFSSRNRSSILTIFGGFGGIKRDPRSLLKLQPTKIEINFEITEIISNNELIFFRDGKLLCSNLSEACNLWIYGKTSFRNSSMTGMEHYHQFDQPQKIKFDSKESTQVRKISISDSHVVILISSTNNSIKDQLSVLWWGRNPFINDPLSKQSTPTSFISGFEEQYKYLDVQTSRNLTCFIVSGEDSMSRLLIYDKSLASTPNDGEIDPIELELDNGFKSLKVMDNWFSLFVNSSEGSLKCLVYKNQAFRELEVVLDDMITNFSMGETLGLVFCNKIALIDFGGDELSLEQEIFYDNFDFNSDHDHSNKYLQCSSKGKNSIKVSQYSKNVILRVSNFQVKNNCEILLQKEDTDIELSIYSVRRLTSELKLSENLRKNLELYSTNQPSSNSKRKKSKRANSFIVNSQTLLQKDESRSNARERRQSNSIYSCKSGDSLSNIRNSGLVSNSSRRNSRFRNQSGFYLEEGYHQQSRDLSASRISQDRFQDNQSSSHHYRFQGQHATSTSYLNNKSSVFIDQYLGELATKNDKNLCSQRASDFKSSLKSMMKNIENKYYNEKNQVSSKSQQPLNLQVNESKNQSSSNLTKKCQGLLNNWKISADKSTAERTIQDRVNNLKNDVTSNFSNTRFKTPISSQVGERLDTLDSSIRENSRDQRKQKLMDIQEKLNKISINNQECTDYELSDGDSNASFNKVSRKFGKGGNSEEDRDIDLGESPRWSLSKETTNGKTKSRRKVNLQASQEYKLARSPLQKSVEKLSKKKPKKSGVSSSSHSTTRKSKNLSSPSTKVQQPSFSFGPELARSTEIKKPYITQKDLIFSILKILDEEQIRSKNYGMEKILTHSILKEIEDQKINEDAQYILQDIALSSMERMKRSVLGFFIDYKLTKVLEYFSGIINNSMNKANRRCVFERIQETALINQQIYLEKKQNDLKIGKIGIMIGAIENYLCTHKRDVLMNLIKFNTKVQNYRIAVNTGSGLLNSLAKNKMKNMKLQAFQELKMLRVKMVGELSPQLAGLKNKMYSHLTKKTQNINLAALETFSRGEVPIKEYSGLKDQNSLHHSNKESVERDTLEQYMEILGSPRHNQDSRNKISSDMEGIHVNEERSHSQEGQSQGPLLQADFFDIKTQTTEVNISQRNLGSPFVDKTFQPLDLKIDFSQQEEISRIQKLCISEKKSIRKLKEQTNEQDSFLAEMRKKLELHQIADFTVNRELKKLQIPSTIKKSEGCLEQPDQLSIEKTPNFTNTRNLPGGGLEDYNIGYQPSHLIESYNKYLIHYDDSDIESSKKSINRQQYKREGSSGKVPTFKKKSREASNSGSKYKNGNDKTSFIKNSMEIEEYSNSGKRDKQKEKQRSPSNLEIVREYRRDAKLDNSSRKRIDFDQYQYSSTDNHKIDEVQDSKTSLIQDGKRMSQQRPPLNHSKTSNQFKSFFSILNNKNRRLGGRSNSKNSLKKIGNKYVKKFDRDRSINSKNSSRSKATQPPKIPSSKKRNIDSFKSEHIPTENSQFSSFMLDQGVPHPKGSTGKKIREHHRTMVYSIVESPAKKKSQKMNKSLLSKKRPRSGLGYRSRNPSNSRSRSKIQDQSFNYPLDNSNNMHNDSNISELRKLNSNRSNTSTSNLDNNNLRYRERLESATIASIHGERGGRSRTKIKSNKKKEGYYDRQMRKRRYTDQSLGTQPSQY